MKFRIVLSFVSIFFCASIIHTETYSVDAGHSSVGFSVRHFVINRVHGSFSDFSGTIIYDPANTSNGSVRGKIQVASINTNNEKRDQDLRGANFFDSSNHPEIIFESTKVEGEKGNLNVTGNFSMHGITKEISFPVRISGPVQDLWGKQRIGISARLTISRRDFGILYDRKMDNGDVVLSNEVEIEIDAEAVAGS